MSLTELTKEYDKKKVELERLQEQTATVQTEVRELARKIATELELDQPFRLNGDKPARKQREGGGTKRITKERVWAWLSESEKGMTLPELVRLIEQSPDGFKTMGLEDRLAPILSEVATSKGDRYSAKKSWTSSRGRGK